MSNEDHASQPASGGTSGALDVERNSDVPISTQIYWQLAYQIDSGRLLPGSRLPPVRELGAALRVNPNTIRAVYRRLADAGYVNSRHGAGTHVADRPPQRRGAETLAGIVSEMLRRAAHAGFTADEVAAATFAAATERKRPGPARPGPLRRVHERRRRLRRGAAGRRVPGPDRGRGHAARRPARAPGPVPLRPRRDDDVPRRRGPGARRPAGCRSWRCSSGRATSSSSTRSPDCRRARGSGSSARRSAARTTSPRRSRCRARRASRSLTAIDRTTTTDLAMIDRTADLILHVARGASPKASTRGSTGRSASVRGRTSSTRPVSSSSGGPSSMRPPPVPARRHPTDGRPPGRDILRRCASSTSSARPASATSSTPASSASAATSSSSDLAAIRRLAARLERRPGTRRAGRLRRRDRGPGPAPRDRPSRRGPLCHEPAPAGDGRGGATVCGRGSDRRRTRCSSGSSSSSRRLRPRPWNRRRSASRSCC